ncbi:hypothetical protein Taro_019616, partial [Colocasia esculenta]|nr:hypothetical protein [Colocasia esculenta]
MERVLSVEEISNHVWPSSSSSPHSGAGSSEAKMMNRSPSEWAFQRFLQEAVPTSPSPSLVSTAAGPHPVSPDPAANADAKPSIPVSAVSRRKDADGGDELPEAKSPPPPPPARLPRPLDVLVDSDEYHEYLKQQLNLACAAAAAVLSRASATKTQESTTVTEPNCCVPDASQTGEQAHITGSGLRTDDNKGEGPNTIPSLPAMQSSAGQARPTTSCSSRELSDDEELEGETEMTENKDPSDAKRVRRILESQLHSSIQCATLSCVIASYVFFPSSLGRVLVS